MWWLEELPLVWRTEELPGTYVEGVVTTENLGEQPLILIDGTHEREAIAHDIVGWSHDERVLPRLISIHTPEHVRRAIVIMVNTYGSYQREDRPMAREALEAWHAATMRVRARANVFGINITTRFYEMQADIETALIMGGSVPLPTHSLPPR